MPVTELAFRPDVNVSIATGNGRFSAVDQWPVLDVHRGVPGRFPEEKARQVDRLRKLADLVESVELDLEMERLFQEGDTDGLLRRVQVIVEKNARGRRRPSDKQWASFRAVEREP